MNNFDTINESPLSDVDTANTNSSTPEKATPSRLQRMSELAKAICETTALHVYYLEASKQASDASMVQKLLDAAALVRERARQLLLEAANLLTEKTEWWQWLGCECQLHERRVRYFLQTP